MSVRTPRRLTLEVLEDRWAPAVGPVGPVVWINPGDGDWNDASNWSTLSVPALSDDVIIGSGVVVTYASTPGGARSLDCDGGLVITGGSLELSEASSIADLALSGGTLFAGDVVTVTDSFDWT